MAKKDYLDPAKNSDVWRERYALARTNQERMFKRFADYYDALYAQVSRIPSPWRSKLYIPKMSQQVWTLVGKFLSLKPGFEARVTDPDVDDEDIEEIAEKSQRKLEYDYNNTLFDESIRDKLFSPLLDAVVTGTGMAKVPWTVQTVTKYSRLTDPNDGSLDLSKHKKKEIKAGFNDLIPVNIFNVFASPAAKGSVYKAPWLIIKEYKPISELEAVNKAEGVVIYKNLNKLNGKVTYDQYAAYDRARNRMLANADPTDKTVKMVAVFECYEGDTICTYAESGGESSDEGWILLREQKNPYWHGKWPLVKFHVKKRPYQFWGEGLFDITFRLAAALNDAVNHYFDAWNVSVDPMLIAPETANVDDYIIEPAGLITYRGDKEPTPFKHAAPDPEMLQTATELINSAIEGVTISQYASGVPDSASDKTKGTATGIIHLQEAAGDVVGFMKENFMQSLLVIGRMWNSNNQQFMIRPVTVDVNTKDGKKSVEIKPEDLRYETDITIDEASMDPLTDDQKLQNAMAFNAQLIELQKASIEQANLIGTQPVAIDFAALTEDLAEDFNKKGFRKILIQKDELQQLHQQQMQQAMQHVQMAQQQQQAEAQPDQENPVAKLMESLNIKFELLPEDVQHQLIQQIFQIQSSMPTPTAQNMMLKAADIGVKAQTAEASHTTDAMKFVHQVRQDSKQNDIAQQQVEQPQETPVNV